MRSTVEAGGASPDNARRTGPLGVTFHGFRHIWRVVVGLAVVLGGAQRDTAGTAGGRSPGVPCAAAAAP
jgi:hypothetical protein